MWERLTRMLVKELIQIFRDPKMRAIVFVTPVVQLFIIGYAVTTDITHIPTAVADFDRTPASRELVQQFDGSRYFEVVRWVRDARELRDLLDRGAVKAALQLDPGFATDLARGRTALLQVLVDGTDSNTASVVLAYSSRIVARFNRAEAERRAVARSTPAPGGLPARIGAIDLQARAWYNPELRSRNYYVPGVMALLIMVTSLLLTSMAIVREREIGTMEQLMVTPIRPAELILGKTLPFALTGFFDMALITVVAVFWFEVPIQGSLLLLVGATALYLLSSLGVGLYISTVSRTQQEAMMSAFFFLQPAMLLSGFVFPIANMPQAIQYLTYLNPLRYYLVVIRGIFLKGSGPGVLWPELLALLVIGTVVFTASTLKFRKRLD